MTSKRAGIAAARWAATLVMGLFILHLPAGAPRAEEDPHGPGAHEHPPVGSGPAPSGTAILKAADFTAKDLRGKAVTLSDLLKKGPVLLDFWTTWCSPCKREMPELDRLHRTYRDRGFTVLAISEDDPKTTQKVKPMIDAKKYELVVLLDPEKKVGNLYNVRGIYPTSYLVAQDHSIAHFAQGYLPGDEKKIETLVRGLLGLGAGDVDDSVKPK